MKVNKFELKRALFAGLMEELGCRTNYHRIICGRCGKADLPDTYDHPVYDGYLDDEPICADCFEQETEGKQ